MIVRHAILLAAATIAIPVGPALAQHAAMPSFFSLEYHYSSSEVVAAARSQLDEYMPTGTPVADAKVLLKHAGARCRDLPGGALHCKYNKSEFADDIMQDVVWTVDVAATDGAVSGVTIDRE